jgi:membrane protein YqaA with SNARE-associated domain
VDTLIEITKEFVATYGLFGLAVLSFTEAFINPIPISPILASSTFLGLPLLPAFVVTLIANLLGAVFGFFLGEYFGHPICVKLFGKKRVDKAEEFFAKWGEIGVVIMAFTPLPFKVATWAAGIFEMRFWHFFAAAMIGRTAHFLVVIGIVYFGWEAISFLTG